MLDPRTNPKAKGIIDVELYEDAKTYFEDQVAHVMQVMIHHDSDGSCKNTIEELVKDDNGDERESENEIDLEDLIVPQPHKKQRTTMMDTPQKVIHHWNMMTDNINWNDFRYENAKGKLENIRICVG